MIRPGLRQIFGKVLDWVYPPICVSCGKPGALICDECFSQLPEVGDHYCSVCGKPLKRRQYCRLCGRSEFHFQTSRAPFLYERPVSDMIRKLKFNGILGLVPVLSKLLSDFFLPLSWNVDLIVPVPLSRKGMAQRGFNQSELIAAAFAESCKIPCDSRALMKLRETKQQVGLDAEERQKNLKGAFAAEPVLVREKQVLLLDDVMTTGSTFSECTDALLDAGARSVKCLSVATTLTDRGKAKTLHTNQRNQ